MIYCAQHLKSFAASQETSVFEHVSAARVQSPEAALTWLVWAPRDLDKAVVEGQVVSQGVLPPLGVFSVVRESIHDELVDLAEREHLLRAALDRHGSERDVRVRWLLVAVRVSPWTRHPRQQESNKKQRLKKVASFNSLAKVFSSS